MNGKIKRRYISLAIILIMILELIIPSFMIQSKAQDVYSNREVTNIEDYQKVVEIDGYVYVINTENNTANLCGKVFEKIVPDDLVIPDYITVDGTDYTITRIAEYAFDSIKIDTVKLPKYLETIGHYAFYSSGLKKVEMSDTVKVIGLSAFEKNKLTKIELSKSLVTIENAAFAHNYLLEVTIPMSVKEMWIDIFYDNPYLEKATFLGSTIDFYHSGKATTDKECAEIIKNIFYPRSEFLTIYCQEGSDIERYVSLTDIDHGNVVRTFDADGLLYREISPRHVEVIGRTSDDEIEELYGQTLVVPEQFEKNGKTYTVISINDEALMNLKVHSVKLPNTLNYIGERAFYGCEQLTRIIVPENTRFLESECFANCPSLGNVYIPKNTEIDGLIFGKKDNPLDYPDVYGYKDSEIYNFCKLLKIKFIQVDELEDIGDIVINGLVYQTDSKTKSASVVGRKTNFIMDVFYPDRNLVIPEKIEYNGDEYQVVQISSRGLNIINREDSLDNYFKTITLPQSLKFIQPMAFNYCNGIEKITIPKNVQELNLKAFSNVTVGPEVIEISDENPNYSYENGLLYNKDKSVLYGALKVLEDENAEEDIPESVKEIDGYAFSNHNEIKKVTIRPSVEKISNYAFTGIEDTVTIRGYSNTYAQQYASEHNIKFERIGIFTTLSKFIFEKDNYSFINGYDFFSSYDMGDYKQYLTNSLLQEAYDEEALEWRGSCAGMAITAGLFKYGVLDTAYWSDGSAKNVYSLNNTTINNRLRWLINFYQTFQNQMESTMLAQTDIEGQPEIEGFYNGVKKHYEEIYDNADVLVTEYSWFDNNENWYGHEILVTGAPEELDEQFQTQRGNVFANYKYRIPTYDVNYYMQTYIYIPADFSTIAFGTDTGLLSWGISAEAGTSYNRLDRVNAYSVDVENIVSLEEIIKNNGNIKFDDFTTVTYNANIGMKLSNNQAQSASISKNGTVTGDLNCKVEPIIEAEATSNTTATDTAVNSSVRRAGVIVENSDYYAVETENETDALDVSIQFPDSYMTAKTSAGASVIFENKKSLTLNNTTGKDYEVKVTLNSEYATLPWFTLKATGSEAKEIKLEMTEEGALISGDNLSTLKIEGNNAEDKVSLDVNTDQNKVLIKADDSKKELMAFIDTDGDGKFETNLAGDTTKEENNTQQAEDIKNAQTGDTVWYAIFGLVIALMLVTVVRLIEFLR